MIEIEIDGEKFQVEPGKMIIEVADEAGIPIPRFCYHKKLSIAANCRMCLVDVEKAPKPLPACATPITDGMIVRTQSAKALDAQRAVMEFLLLNHPLDCPICDQGGECELQDVAMGYGKDYSRYEEGKRAVEDPNLGSLVATDMTRCIHCTRCVRFGQEIAGVPELGTMGRGDRMLISTYVEKSLNSELSGNIIDLCPVGALTSKPFRFRARAWEMEQTKSISPHDCVGSNLYLQSRRQEVLRVAPRENEAINETWLSDRDRFSYLGLNHPERLAKPIVKQNGEWKEVDWQYALNVAADGLQKVVQAQGGQRLGGLISPNSTLEEMYLLQKLMRHFGSQNIDHRLQQIDTQDQKFIGVHPGMNFSLASIEEQPFIMLLGSHIQREQPIIAHRIRQANLQGSAVFAINSIRYPFPFDIQNQLIIKPSEYVTYLAQLTKALLVISNEDNKDLHALLQDIQVSEEVTLFAKQLKQYEKGIILLGAIAQNHPYASLIHYFADAISKLIHAQIGILTAGANSAGAWLAGAIPHRGPAQKTIAAPGLSTKQMFDNPLAAYVLMNIEPELDCAFPQTALRALEKADVVIALTPYLTDTMQQYADIILPIAPFSESSGTFVNVEGQWQSFTGSVQPFGEARPGWKVLRVLGNLCQVEGFEYASSLEVLEEVKALTDSMLSSYHKPLEGISKIPAPYEGVERIVEWPIYRSDNLVRRAAALQASLAGEEAYVWLHSTLAQQLQVSAGDKVLVSAGEHQVELHVSLDDSIHPACAYIPAGFGQTSQLNESFAKLTIVRSQ